MSKKQNYSYIGIAFIILVFGIIFIPKIVDRIKNNDITRSDRMTQEQDNNFSNQSSLSFLEINGKRKKVPAFSFVNHKGDTITQNDYLGKVYVVEFFFTTCPTICPKMNRNLVHIQNAFTSYNDFGIASFSINPTHDTPEVLSNYAKQYGITNPNWHLMTGNKEAVYELANKGFNIFAGENPEVAGGFEHSGNFALIDKNGYIRSRMDNFGNPKIFYSGVTSIEDQVDDDGQKEEITMLKEDIKKLLNE
ncbi:SCO family protein [Mangrovimonas spongiae]|uniref:SCO family protein n=1 Tax=Mangrovimonas spongiae TaxID=2494697 RepID=A0A3R9M8L5_9FLAO|nr:SCO family protein [Mangrovimonas spongiae]RSK39798.1 SCO family protein [Mangrovimonas spongiae]